MAKKAAVKADVNPFDSIAQTAPTAKSSKTRKVFAAANEDLNKTIEEYITAKAKMKEFEAQLKSAEEKILTYVTPIHDRESFAGNFTKSVDLASRLTVTYMDKFSNISNPEAREALKNLLGVNFEKAFEIKRAVTIKPDAVKNVELIQKFIAAAKAAGLNPADVFEVIDVLTAKDGLDELQYQIVTEEQLPKFRAYCRQAKASVK